MFVGRTFRRFRVLSWCADMSRLKAQVVKHLQIPEIPAGHLRNIIDVDWYWTIRGAFVERQLALESKPTALRVSDWARNRAVVTNVISVGLLQSFWSSSTSSLHKVAIHWVAEAIWCSTIYKPQNVCNYQKRPNKMIRNNDPLNYKADMRQMGLKQRHHQILSLHRKWCSRSNLTIWQ